ncbi:MAG: cob(I)yrinic acid a,c-diamide adenosyltransferase [Thomasclavelia sp.]|jgi:cob(I)alamin adenosyltransferase|nr:cob(I)yrinic acid a,c-diamide adenosyltransferase [Thomasclavelia sp.]
MLHIYYGNGKGKTSAAMGLALRQLATGHKVQILSFLKDGNSSEIKILKDLGCKVNFKKMPTRFIDMNDPTAIKEVSKLENELFDEIDEDCDCLILDELLDVITLSMINEDKVYQLVSRLKNNKEIVMTGRMPSHNIKVLSDYSTEMKKHKHPYDRGIMAREGVEY